MVQLASNGRTVASKVDDDESSRRGEFFLGNLPYDVLIIIFDKLTIVEKLRTMSVSRGWRSLATASLRKESSLRACDLSGCRLEIREGEIIPLISKMSQPSSPFTNLKIINFRYMTGCRTDRGAVTEKITSACPKLQGFCGFASSNHLPYFAKNCKKLKYLICEDFLGAKDNFVATERHIRTLVRECLHLKELEFYNFQRKSKLASPFEDARCSLEILTIRLLNQDIPAILEKFPKLCKLADWNESNAVEDNDEEDDFITLSPLKELSLVILDLLWYGPAGVAIFDESFSHSSPLSKSLLTLQLGGDWGLFPDEPHDDKYQDASAALRNLGSICSNLLSPGGGKLKIF